MSQDTNLSRNPDYFAARAIEERRLAMAASDSNARAAHLELAEQYSRLAKEAGAAPEPMAEEQQRAS
jgi:hypothetical protein